MTAIKAAAAAVNNSSPTKRRSSQSLTAARTQFLDSVNHGIEELMRFSGYGRERATNTLMRELGRGGQAPSENEIFHLMELQGLGMEDSAKALVVSKAVRRAMKDQGFSAIEAIDDLTAKLCLANLLQSALPEKEQQEQHHAATRQSTPLRRVAPVAVSQRKPSARKTVKSKLAKASGNKVETTNKLKNPRKRAASSEVEATKTGRARADSVAEEVNAKIATQQPPEPKGKRDGPPNQQQPASKRPREA